MKRFIQLSFFLSLIALFSIDASDASALDVNSTGTATLTAGTLTPGSTVTIDFTVTPLADSPIQNDYADGFYTMLPPGWVITSISNAPAPNVTATATQCGIGHTVSQAFCNATVDGYPFAYWGHAEGTIDACGYRIPAGSECGTYESDVGVPLVFSVTAQIPANAPVCINGTVDIPLDETDPNSLIGVLVSDGYAAPNTSWIEKNYVIPFTNLCPQPLAISLSNTTISSGKPLVWLVLISVITLMAVTVWGNKRVTRSVITVLTIAAVGGTVTYVMATPPSQGYNSTGHALADPGIQAITTSTTTVTRSLSGSGTFSAELIHPTSMANAPYPAVIFAHGFQQGVGNYQSLIEHVASHGYVVVAPNTQTGLFGVNHQTYVNEMRDSIDHIIGLNTNAGPLQGSIDVANIGIFGHSMGGGAAVQTAGDDARIAALMAFAPAELNSGGASAIAAALNITAPTMFVAGTGDSIVPNAGNGQDMYDVIPAPKQLLDVQGADHCAWQDSVSPFDAGLFCGSSSLSRADSRAMGRRLVVAFFNQHLKGEDRPHWRLSWGVEKMNDAIFATTQIEPNSALTAGVTAGSGMGGTTVSYTATIENTGTSAGTYTLSASANRWAVGLDKGSVTLASGATDTVTVTVTLPAGASAKRVREDTVILSAESAEGARSYIELTTTLTP